MQPTHLDPANALRAHRTFAAAPAWLLPSLGSGLIAGLTAVVAAASFAALLFSGPLAPAINQGLALALLAAAINTLGVALWASMPGTVGGTQSLPVAILGSTAATLAAPWANSAGSAGSASLSPALLTTVVAAFGLTTLATGLALILLGQLRLGRVVRFLPYPVLGGVLAGSAWLLAQGAFGIMVSDAHLSLQGLVHALPGLGWAGLMLWLHHRAAHPLALLGALALGIALFYGVAYGFGSNLELLHQHGWLLQPAHQQAQQGAMLHPWAGMQWAAIDWAALGQVAPQLATVPLVTAVALLLNAAALENAAREPIELDSELRAAGRANALSGLMGGLPGYPQLSLSLMNLAAGARTRWVGAWASLVCLGALLGGAQWLAYLPRPVLGALLLFLAMLMVRDWVLASWGRLSAQDHGVVLVIVILTATLGFLPAVILGLATALVLFATHYGRIDAVRQELSGAQFRSRVAWTAEQRLVLAAQGDRTFILPLQGFLFFGIADRLLVRVRRRLAETARPALGFVVLDCRRVTGVDSSAAQSLKRLHELLEPCGAQVVITGASEALTEQFELAGLPRLPTWKPPFSDLDHGLEWIEAQLLADTPSTQGHPLLKHLSHALGSESKAAALLQQMDPITLETGEALITQGEAPNGLFLLAHGALSAQRDRPGDSPVRLQTLIEGGNVLGEVGFYLGVPRTANVVATAPSVVYRLTTAHLNLLEQNAPAVAAALHRWVASLLAERVAHLGSVVDALES
jgi:sulfate permease, SulP family